MDLLTTAIISISYTVIASIIVCKVMCPLEATARENISNNSSDQVNTSKVHVSKKILYNETLGITKPYHEGFSWTVLLFGFWPAVFREDWKYALIMFALPIPTCGISIIYFAFKYNDLYTKNLLEKGYKIVE